ncbi:S-adenosyl-L-methionine-dependent methyltransferase [Aspergillus pseudoustus]|uniref:S-adenosyl-L-methionine-dependent methyltransferase n=1 Tax=Aspergillus pseudoustus TaxID=1810923 RepID=A0ABR4JDQ4_9EURO
MAEPTKPSPGEYMLIRSNAESERLEKQFRAWQANIGYLLHPAIIQHDHMRIADVGTGTGIWLRELAGVVPATCELDGFDLSDSMFSRDGLPGNIKFYHQNFLEPFPEEFRGKYDVINVRVMVVALAADEWAPAVRNLITLLRPGGYLQWVDCAAHDCVVKVPEGVDGTHAAHYMEKFRTGMIAVGKAPNLGALHGIFQESGLADCEERICPLVNPDTREDINDTVIGGITHFLMAALNRGKIGLVRSTEEVMSLRKSALDDLSHGCYYCFDVHVVVGRKI